MFSENQIIIKDVKVDAIKQALQQWLELRIDEDNTNLIFKLYKKGTDKLVIMADPRLIEVDFFYLINFLSNSTNNDRKGTIEGYTIGKNIEPFKEKKLHIFVSEDDLELSVSVITEEDIFYTVEFDGIIIRNDEVKKYNDPELVNLEIPEIIEFEKIESQKRNRSRTIITYRFIIFSIILFVVTSFALKIKEYNMESFNIIFNSIGLALGMWFYLDFKMLRLKLFYFLSFLIAISFLFIGIYLKKGCPGPVLDIEILFPVILLLVQITLRTVFKYFCKKEPEVNRFGSLADQIYTALLLLLTFAVIYFIIIGFK